MCTWLGDVPGACTEETEGTTETCGTCSANECAWPGRARRALVVFLDEVGDAFDSSIQHYGVQCDVAED